MNLDIIRHIVIKFRLKLNCNFSNSESCHGGGGPSRRSDGISEERASSPPSVKNMIFVAKNENYLKKINHNSLKVEISKTRNINLFFNRFRFFICVHVSEVVALVIR